jgi:hypothetical protein
MVNKFSEVSHTPSSVSIWESAHNQSKLNLDLEHFFPKIQPFFNFFHDIHSFVIFG